jgi:hypothetical protein
LTGQKTDATQNTLRLIDQGVLLETADITPAGASLTNIGNLEISATTVADLSTAGTLFSGVTNVTLDSAGAIAGLTVGAAQKQLCLSSCAKRSR